MSKCKIVMFSDVHYSSEVPTSKDKLTQYSIDLIDKLVDTSNNIVNPDLIFCLGDLIDDKCDKQEDAKSIKYVLSHFEKFNAPCHTLFGNHDLRPYDTREELEVIMGCKGTYSFDSHGYHFIVLGLSVSDASIKDAYGIARSHYLSADDLTWLDHDLRNTTLPTIIVSHYSIGHDNMSANKWFKDSPCDIAFKNRDVIQKIIRKYDNVIALFNGHEHWTKSMVEDGLPFFTVGSMTENINGDGIPDGVYIIVDLEDKNIQVLDRHIRLQ